MRECPAGLGPWRVDLFLTPKNWKKGGGKRKEKKGGDARREKSGFSRRFSTPNPFSLTGGKKKKKKKGKFSPREGDVADLRFDHTPLFLARPGMREQKEKRGGGKKKKKEKEQSSQGGTLIGRTW